MSTGSETLPMLHCFVQGVSHDVPIAELDIGSESTDQQVKQAVASFLEQPVSKFSGFSVDREPNGNITLRPNATWGKISL